MLKEIIWLLENFPLVTITEPDKYDGILPHVKSTDELAKTTG